MSTYVMSDIHGQKALFDNMLKQINFSDNDELYILGDVIDRGPDGIQILLDIMDKPNIHMMLGNHEYMMKTYFTYPLDVDTLYIWGRNGARPTIHAFQELDTESKEKVVDFIKKLPVETRVHINDKEFILCHAQPHPTSFKNDPFETAAIGTKYITDEEFSVWHRYQVLYHSRYRNDPLGVIPDENFKDKIVVYGHTPTLCMLEEGSESKIFKNNNTINVDCGCAFIDREDIKEKGRLGCIRLEDMQEFYQDVPCRNIEKDIEER